MYPGGVGATAQGQAVKDNVVEMGIWFHDEEFEGATSPYRQDLKLYPLREG